MAATISEDGTVTFSTGETTHAYGGLFSIDSNGDVFGGYDDRLSVDGVMYGEEHRMLTEIERRELAVLMIKQWAKFGGFNIDPDILKDAIVT